MVICLDSGVRCKRFAYGAADATATPSFLVSLKFRLVYSLWCQLPRLSWKRGCDSCLSVWSSSPEFLEIRQGLAKASCLDLWNKYFTSLKAFLSPSQWNKALTGKIV